MAANPPLSLPGLASGLDTNAIVDQLMQVERQPQVRLTNQKAQVTQRQSVLQDLKGRLTTLKLAADALRSPGLFADTQSLDSSDPSKIVATRVSGAGVGGSQVVVSRLASSQRRTYHYTPDTSNDTTLDFGNGKTVSIAAGSDVDAVVTAINSASGAPVFAASIADPSDSTKKLLVLSSKTPGSDGDFSLQPDSTTGLVEDPRRAKTHAAFGAQQVFDYTADPANATTITVNGQAVQIGAGSDAAGVASAINSAGVGATAGTDANGRLVITSSTVGSASTLSVASSQLSLFSSGAGRDATTLNDLNAAYTVDGGSVQFAKSNIVTDAIPGLQLIFKAASADPVTITVGSPAPDHSAIKSAVKDFVTQYNSIVDFLGTKVNEKRVVNPQTPADNLKGLFFGDSLLTSIQSRLRNAVSSPIGSDSTLNLLAQIGLSTGAPTGGAGLNQDSVAGKLTLDESKLDTMLDTNPEGVKKLLGATTGVNGLGQTLDGVLDPEVGAGLDFDQQISSMDRQLHSIADQMQSLDERLKDTEARLKAQFATLESTLSASQNQQQWLAGQIAGLNH